MEEVSLDIPVEAKRPAFDDDLMLDSGMQADELVLELDDLHDKNDEYQAVDLDAQALTDDLEVAVDGIEVQPTTNGEHADASGHAEEDAQDVSMTYNDEIGYEEEEEDGVRKEAATEHEPEETNTSKAPPADDEILAQRESEQEGHNAQIDMSELKKGDDVEGQPSGRESGTENSVNQVATQQAADTDVGQDVDGLAAVSEAEQAGEAVSEDHHLEESPSDHDEAIVDDAAFSITDITVQYQGSSYALFGNSDMDPDTYFLLDTEIATAPLSELLASIRSVIATELTPGEELVIAIDSLDLNFGERSSRDFLQRSFHQIIYCYNVLLAKGIVTETSLTLNLLVRSDPEGRFLELLEEAGIWSGADYSPDYSDASGEDEYLEDEEEIEDLDDNDNDNEGLEDHEDHDDHEDIQDYEFDDQEQQDEEGQQDQDQKEEENNQEPEGFELTENVEATDDVQVADDIEVSADVAETGNVTVSTGDIQAGASTEHAEPQVTQDVPENQRDTEQFSLEENVDQAAQAEPSADINGESHIGAGESAHGPSGIVDVEHETVGDLGELQPNPEGTGSALEHAPEMESATDEPQPENGDPTEAINEEEEEEAYDEDEYLEHHEEAEAEEQGDDEVNHAEGAVEFGDDLTLRQTLDDGNFSLDIMEESTEGNAVLDLDNHETGKYSSFFCSTQHSPGTHNHPRVSGTSEAKDDDLIDYTDDEGPTHIKPSLERKPSFPDLSLRAKRMKTGETDRTMPPPPFHSDSACTEKSNSPVNFSAPQRDRGGRFHSYKDSDFSVTFSAYDADLPDQGTDDISTSHHVDSAAIQDNVPNMNDYTDVQNALEVEYTHDTSHITIDTTEPKDQTEEGAHDFAAEEPVNHTSTTNTLSGDEIDYDEHEEQDVSLETDGQVQEFSNAQDDEDEIGWGDDGEEDNDGSTQQTTTSQDQPPFTAKRGRTDDLDEETEEAGTFNSLSAWKDTSLIKIIDVKRRRT